MPFLTEYDLKTIIIILFVIIICLMFALRKINMKYYKLLQIVNSISLTPANS